MPREGEESVQQMMEGLMTVVMKWLFCMPCVFIEYDWMFSDAFEIACHERIDDTVV